MPARYVDLSAQAKPIIMARLALFIEAAAIIVRDAIVAVIEESTPRGRRYFVPGTRTLYTASAPGQPPAVREGVYVAAWKVTPAVVEESRVLAGVFNDRFVGKSGDIPLWLILEEGTTPQLNLFVGVGGGMAPRPHIMDGILRAMPDVEGLARSVAAA